MTFLCLDSKTAKVKEQKFVPSENIQFLKLIVIKFNILYSNLFLIKIYKVWFSEYSIKHPQLELKLTGVAGILHLLNPGFYTIYFSYIW